jgi:hypothetical protein
MAGLPTDSSDNLCIDKSRIDILKQFSAGTQGNNRWYPLKAWGSDIYFESSPSDQQVDWSFLSQKFDNATIEMGSQLFEMGKNSSGLLGCNAQSTQFGNSFCGSQLKDTGACCMTFETNNMPTKPTYGEGAMLWQMKKSGYDGQVCVDSGKQNILKKFNAMSSGDNIWIPLEKWGSTLAFGNQCAVDRAVVTKNTNLVDDSDDDEDDEDEDDDDLVELDDEDDEDDDDEKDDQLMASGKTNLYMASYYDKATDYYFPGAEVNDEWSVKKGAKFLIFSTTAAVLALASISN